MYNTRLWLRTLTREGFTLQRTKGGHARYRRGPIAIDVPIHHRELSKGVVASIKRVLKEMHHV